MDQAELERSCEEDEPIVEKRVCEACRGSALLPILVHDDPSGRFEECFYCGGKGWLAVLPVRAGAYW